MRNPACSKRPDLEPVAAARGRVRRLAMAAALGIVAGSCSSGPAPTTFDLTAPSRKLGSGAVSGQVVVAEPVAIQTFEADRIIVKDGGAVSFLGGGQWADRLPRLVQARMIQTFENASRIRAVSRPGDRITADYVLTTEIRSFLIDAAASEAVVELSVKVVNDRTGRISTAKVFSAREPVTAVDAASAARSLDQALSRVLLDIVRFVGA
jgi:cholesterol transport system auxiliary component